MLIRCLKIFHISTTQDKCLEAHVINMAIIPYRIHQHLRTSMFVLYNAKCLCIHDADLAILHELLDTDMLNQQQLILKKLQIQYTRMFPVMLNVINTEYKYLSIFVIYQFSIYW